MENEKKPWAGWLARLLERLKKSLKLGNGSSLERAHPSERCPKWPGGLPEKVEDLPQ